MYQKVMVIDDSDLDLFIAKTSIQKYQFSDETITCKSVNKAIEFLNAGILNPSLLPDLIFVDINMPELNGFDFLERFQVLSQQIQTKCMIVMLTSSMNQEDMQRAQNNPLVNEYINKPLEKNKLDLLRALN